MIKTLVLATHNKGKVREFEKLLQGLVDDIKCAADWNLIEPAETGTTFVENAKIKAMFAMQATGLPALADDSGICVNALNGEPGVYTADWAGYPRDFNKAMALVHEKMGDAADRSAHFTSVLVLAYPDGQVESFEGKVHGHMTWPPRGDQGFGFDPVFIADGYDKTFAEIDPDEKNKISHRARAVEILIQHLKGKTS